METILESHVTEHMLNDFASEGKKKARLPAAFVDAFCTVVGDERLRALLLGAKGRNIFQVGKSVKEMIAAEKQKFRKRKP
jgi:hypothetical protein